MNKGRDIPEHSIKRIYILKIFDAPKRQIKPPKSNADIAMNFSLLNSLKEQIKIPPNIVPNDHTNSLIAKALTLLLNLRFTNTGVKKAGADRESTRFSGQIRAGYAGYGSTFSERTE